MFNRRTTLLGVVVCIGVSAGLVGCKDPEEVSKAVSIKLDPALKQEEKDVLRNDIAAMLRFNLGAPADDTTGTVTTPKSWYRQVFGGVNTLDALQYLDLRVNYVLPESVNIRSRVRVPLFPI